MIDRRDHANLPTGASLAYFLVPLLAAERYRSDGVPRAVIAGRMGQREADPLLVRIDMSIEVAYYVAGGIIPYVLEQVASASPGQETGEVRVA